ncbi:CapA family protein [Brevibacillus daliensis]|uniref:CapA family protein n=1 Tax=Brevibacillus daliensis TaxID=2892995 RepID=UPI001E295004|nr:CapA family protein [Brevibacillus daliensis]
MKQNPKSLNRTEKRRSTRKRKKLRMHMLFYTFLMTAILLFGSVLIFSDELSTAFFSDKQTSGEPPIEPEQTQEQTVRLSFAGDIMMAAGHVETLLKDKGYEYAFAHVKDLFLQDDYTVGNLETPLTENGAPADNKEYVYKSSPLAAPAMKASGIDLLNLANNHSMDQGESGLLDTMQALEQHELAYIGSGNNADRAYSPVYVERNGIKIAFLGFTRVIPETSWYAGKNKPGLAVSYDPAKAVEAISQAKNQADVVIVIAHWGKEKVDNPVDHQKELAHAYIDAGADLIVGGHPHVLQGFEQYKGKWIAYSTGNFIFTRAPQPKTWETMVLQATLTKDGGCELQVIPHHAELGQAVPMNEAESDALLKRLESISENGVKIDEQGYVRKS